MLSKLVVLGILVLIGLLVVYLFHDSPVAKKFFESAKNIPSDMKKKKRHGAVKIADSPVFFIKAPGAVNYTQVDMMSKKTTFGSGKNCDVVLEDETVEPMHVTVEKLFIDNDVCYELVNYSKNNPVEYLNQEKGAYEYLGYKKGILLEANEAFYIGETKMIVKCPVKHHTVSKTERVFSVDSFSNGNTRTMEETADTERTASVVSINEKDVVALKKDIQVAPTVRVEKAEPTIRVNNLREFRQKMKKAAN